VAVTIDVSSNDVLTIEEFVDYVERSTDVRDFDSLCECAPAFKALINNRTLLSSLIARELRSWRDFQRGNSYVGTTLILARTPQFFVRANTWLPDKPRSRAHGDSAVYGLTHDHNFSFMTGGYQGSGYTTEIYELDGKTQGLPGERVKLEFLERTTLPTGKIMVYRSLRDVHRQSRPEELSVSINLVVPADAKTRPQYFFNLERSEISLTDYPEHGRALALFKLAKHAGNAETNRLLGDIAGACANPRLRARAFEALCECAPETAGALVERALGDPDPLVRATAEQAVQRSQHASALFPNQQKERSAIL